MADRVNHDDELDRFTVGYHLSEPAYYADEEHEAVQVCIPMARARYRVDRQSAGGRRLTQELCSRDILVLPAGQTHAITWRRPAGVVTLYLSGAFLADTLKRPALDFADTLTLRDPFITSAAAELAVALELEGSANPLYTEALVTVIAYRLGSNADGWHPGSAAADPPLAPGQRARLDDFIDAHLDQRVTLGELAAVIGLSNWHFLRRFSATHGMTPSEYLTARRYERASRMLRETSLSITQIALEVGLSHCHFSRTFLRRFAMSPSEFRKREH